MNRLTYIGKNSPLHFAVLYENLEAVKLLLKSETINLDLMNL